MAHNIANINGKEAFFSGRNEKTWHGLGQSIAGTATWQQAIELAGLNWQVVKEALYDANGIELPTYGIFRDIDHAFLGSVGARYTPIQNSDAFGFVDALIGNDGAHYDTAGALGNGEVIFCSAHLPSAGFEVVPGDKHQTYLLFKTSHDGSLSAICKLTDVRVVCNNTLNQALRKGGEYIKVKHTKSASDRLDQAKKLICAGKNTADDIRDKMRQLANKKVTRESMETIFARLFPQDKKDMSTKTRNNISDILNIYESNDNNAFPEIRGSAYNLLNAVTDYTDHVRTAKGGGKDNMDVFRTQSTLFGSGEAFKESALDIIHEVASMMPSMNKPTYYATSCPVDTILSMVDM